MSRAKGIAISAAGAAIGVAAIAVARFLPSTIPYMVAGLAVYIVLGKCGYFYGVLCYLAVSGLGLLISLTSALPFIFLFGLHVFVSFPLARLGKKLGQIPYWSIRSLCVAVFFNLAFLGVYFLANTAMLDIPRLEEILGGYAFLALIATAAFIFYDIASVIITDSVVKKIK